MWSRHILEIYSSTPIHSAWRDKAASKAMEKVNTDVVGPMNEELIGKSKELKISLDDQSRLSIIRFTSRKPETAKAVKQMIWELKNILNSIVQTFPGINRSSVKCVWSVGGRKNIGHDCQNCIEPRGTVAVRTSSNLPKSKKATTELAGLCLIRPGKCSWALPTVHGDSGLKQ